MDTSRTRMLTTAEAVLLLPDATGILTSHRPANDGLCAGCRALWDRLAPYPCTQAEWAQRVADRVPTPETMALLGWPTAPLQPVGPRRNPDSAHSRLA
jgi:hypothetical protein